MRVEVFADAVSTALGDRLVALLLYGSTAREEQALPRADVNTLLICDAVDDALFAALEPAVQAWARTGRPAPLVFTEREWRESADAFPIEYEDIRQAHRLLAGRDPWAGITVRREDLRRQVEVELMGKLVRLRQAYLTYRSDGKRLTEVIVGSAPGLFTMLRSVLRLSGRPVPNGIAEVAREAAALIGFPATALDVVVVHARGPKRLALAPHDPRAAAYLAVVAQTAEFVNHIA